MFSFKPTHLIQTSPLFEISIVINKFKINLVKFYFTKKQFITIKFLNYRSSSGVSKWRVVMIIIYQFIPSSFFGFRNKKKKVNYSKTVCLCRQFTPLRPTNRTSDPPFWLLFSHHPYNQRNPNPSLCVIAKRIRSRITYTQKKQRLNILI